MKEWGCYALFPWPAGNSPGRQAQRRGWLLSQDEGQVHLDKFPVQSSDAVAQGGIDGGEKAADEDLAIVLNPLSPAFGRKASQKRKQGPRAP